MVWTGTYRSRRLAERVEAADHLARGVLHEQAAVLSRAIQMQEPAADAQIEPHDAGVDLVMSGARLGAMERGTAREAPRPIIADVVDGRRAVIHAAVAEAVRTAMED